MTAFNNNNKLQNFETMQVVKINHAGEEFDRLWAKTKTQYKNTHVRSSDVINWYLVPTQYADREIYAAYEGVELKGYMVVRLSVIKGARFMLCLDLWTVTDTVQNVIKNLLSFVRKEAEDNNCSAFLVPHFSKTVSEVLQKSGLNKLIGKRRNDLFLMPLDVNVPLDVENSYFTYMSGDKFLGKAVI